MGLFEEIPVTKGFQPYGIDTFGPGHYTKAFSITTGNNGIGVAVGDVVKYIGSDGVAAYSAGAVSNSDSVMAGVVAKVLNSRGEDVSDEWDSNFAFGKALKASTAGKVVLFNPYVVRRYLVVEDGDTTPVADASIQLNCGFIAAAYSATDGYSQFKLDSNTVNTTATLPFKIEEVYPSDNTAAGSVRLYVVSINTSALGLAGTLGIS